MDKSNTILPILGRDFDSKSLTEKINYLLSYPVYYTFEIGEIDRLKDFLSYPLPSYSDDFRCFEMFVNQCFRKMKKISFIKWVQLLNLREIDVFPQEKFVSDELYK